MALYAVFTVGILAWLPAATLPLREMLGMLGITV